MYKIDLKEKEKKDILNIRKIIFIVILFIILLVIASILLLIWWPTKASLVEITNSWVALIMVYLVLIVFLFEKPIYKFYSEIIDIINLKQHKAQQAKQKELFKPISNSDFNKLVSYRNSEWDSILKRENQESDSTILKDTEVVKYIQKLQNESIKLRFFFADIYLVLYAKYVLFWLFKLKLAKREDFDKVDCKQGTVLFIML